MDDQGLRADLAEMRGEMRANFLHIGDGQKRHEDELKGIKQEFDQVHKRLNDHDRRHAASDKAIETLESQSGKKIASGSLAVAVVSVVIAVAVKIPWA